MPLTLGWVFFLAVLGVTMAIPMKRQMINIEQLRFPSGIAAAETLRALHSHGEKGMRAGTALGIAGVLAAVNQFWKDGLALDSLRQGPLDAFLQSMRWSKRFNERAFGPGLDGSHRLFDWDPVFIAAGALTGMRASASMLLGGTLCWAVYRSDPATPGNSSMDTGYKEVVKWTLWGGVSCMITSGLLSFGLQWRSVLRAFGSLGKLFSGESTPDAAREMDAIEVPTSWFIAGQLFGLIGLAWLAK